ncbi:MAG: carboxylating nicotinate-nucleotide diphosphorylase [Alphaproteobacteria bacterium]
MRYASGMKLDKTYLNTLVSRALAEDIGAGDITSTLTIPVESVAEMQLLARQEMVVCGVEVPEMVFHQIDASVQVQAHVSDGERVQADTVLVSLKGNARMLLTGERTALNIMQRMSGVATLTRKYVDAIKGTKAVILDTRKTIPGLRVLDKYATRCGGAENHRMRLDDMVLIKDNHIAVCGSIANAVESARAGTKVPIVVECDTLTQVQEALAAKPHRILLDNMDNAMLREAVKLSAGKVPLEASGNVSLETVRGIAETGVDYISVGKITHSAPSVDIGADIKVSF